MSPDGVWRSPDAVSRFGADADGLVLQQTDVARRYHREDMRWKREMKALERKYGKQ